MSAEHPIRKFKGLHAGKRVFILASGPSLGRHDLSGLNRRIVIGLNRSFFVYPESYYHCCMDQRLFDLHPESLKKTRHLFTLEGRPWGLAMKLLGAEGFSDELTEGVYSGYTISYVAMQVAHYLGFNEVIFLGLDLKHEQGKTHFFGSDFNSRNHETTEFPRMQRMLEYGAAELTRRGVRVVNCSPISDLRGFERITFEEAIAL